MNKIYVLFLVAFIIGCKNEYSFDKDIDKNTLMFDSNFPDTVYTHKKYKGTISFSNSMFDTIARPRRDTINFRFLIYKPFKPYKDGDKFAPVYKDSILLEENEIDVELEFDEQGIYNIGGFARDAIRMNYYTNGVRDSARFIEHEMIFMQKVVVIDSVY